MPLERSQHEASNLSESNAADASKKNGSADWRVGFVREATRLVKEAGKYPVGGVKILGMLAILFVVLILLPPAAQVGTTFPIFMFSCACLMVVIVVVVYGLLKVDLEWYRRSKSRSKSGTQGTGRQSKQHHL